MGLFRQLRQAYQQWRNDDGSLLAAAVAYYAALSFFPLLLVLIAGLGLLLQWTDWGQDAESQLLAAIGDYASPAVKESVAGILEQVQQKAAIGGPLGIGMLIFAAAALFSHFEHAFDRIWKLDRRPVAGLLHAVRRIVLFRLRAFLMLVSLLGLTLIVFLAGVALSSLKTHTPDRLLAADWVWSAVESGFAIVINWGLFTLMYRVLPKVAVRWSEAARGGLLAAVAWEVGRLALTALLVGKKYSAYGVVGSFIAVMLWIYFASTVVFLGAEYVQVLRGERKPGSPQPEDRETAENRGAG